MTAGTVVAGQLVRVGHGPSTWRVVETWQGSVVVWVQVSHVGKPWLSTSVPAQLVRPVADPADVVEWWAAAARRRTG